MLVSKVIEVSGVQFYNTDVVYLVLDLLLGVYVMCSYYK